MLASVAALSSAIALNRSPAVLKQRTVIVRLLWVRESEIAPSTPQPRRHDAFGAGLPLHELFEPALVHFAEGQDAALIGDHEAILRFLDLPPFTTIERGDGEAWRRRRRMIRSAAARA